jgi:hypothetical protein
LKESELTRESEKRNSSVDSKREDIAKESDSVKASEIGKWSEHVKELEFRKLRERENC